MRLPTTLFGRLAAAAIAVAITIGVGAYAGWSVHGPGAIPSAQGSTPSATSTLEPSASVEPIDTTSWSPFVSKQYGLQFGVPPTWTVSPAHRSGPGISADTAEAPAKTAAFSASSRPFPEGIDESAGWAAYSASLSSGPTGCDPSAANAFSTIDVDGHTAHLFDVRVECGYGRAVALIGGRIYELTAFPALQGATVGGIDHALFLAWLGTVRFDPPAADNSTPDPLDTTLWPTFASRVDGYEARRSVDWAESPATRPATLEDLASTDDSVRDIFATGNDERLIGASTVLPAGMTQDEWVTSYRNPVVAQFGAPCFPPRNLWVPITVDGHAGGMYTGCWWVESVIFVGNRAYIFKLELSTTTPVSEEHRALLLAFLSTVVFHPEDAVPVGATPIPS